MRINDILVEFAAGDSGDSGNYFQALASAWYNGTFDTGSLQKGIKSQQDVERLLNRGIVCPDGVTRKLHIDYNSDFDGVEIYSDDYYEYGDHDDTIDSRTGQKWGPYDFMAFSDEDLSEGLNEFAPGSGSGESGRWYTDDQMTDLVGDGWWNDLDVSGDIPKEQMIQQAQAWLDDQGYSVQVLNCKVNDDDMEWYIEGSFQNSRFANKGVAEGLNEFAQDGFNGGNDDEGFSPEIAKMAQEHGFTKGASLADGATLEMAMKINHWHTQHGGMYKQYFAKGFKAGRMNKVNHDNKQYNLNLKLMKDGSIRHGEQGVAEGAPISGDGGAVDNFRQQMANRTELAYQKGMAEGNRKSEPPEADYSDDYQDMVKRVKKLAGLGPLKTQYDPARRVYRNMPTAVQPRK
jgi:hypothetical protein